MNEINFDSLFDAVSRRKSLVMACGILGAVVLGAASFLLPTEYRARTLIAPNLNRMDSGALSISSAYERISSLPGIELGDPMYSAVDLGVETLQSRKFLTQFIERHDLGVLLLGAKKWDEDSNTIIIDEDIYDAKAKSWVRSKMLYGSVEPTAGELFEEISSRMSILVDGKTGFIELHIDHLSPEIAADWANGLVEDLNRETMEKEMHEASESIAYLERKIQETPQSNLREVFFALIEDHLRIVTLADISDEYLFRIIDPAVAPEDHFKPKRSLLFLLGGGLGLLMGSFVSLFGRAEDS